MACFSAAMASGEVASAYCALMRARCGLTRKPTRLMRYCCSANGMMSARTVTTRRITEATHAAEGPMPRTSASSQCHSLITAETG